MRAQIVTLVACFVTVGEFPGQSRQHKLVSCVCALQDVPMGNPAVMIACCGCRHVP